MSIRSLSGSMTLKSSAFFLYSKAIHYVEAASQEVVTPAVLMAI
jgi:hypothetical protein